MSHVRRLTARLPPDWADEQANRGPSRLPDRQPWAPWTPSSRRRGLIVRLLVLLVCAMGLQDDRGRLSGPPVVHGAAKSISGQRGDEFEDDGVTQAGVPEMGAAIGTLVGEALAQAKLPGCVVVIGRHDRVLFHKAFGLRQIEPESVPMTDDTVFDLASLTKPIATATSVMVLAERGALRLDDPVVQHLPELGSHDKAGITIRDLLIHIGGFPADTGFDDYEHGLAFALRRFNEQVLRAPPRTRFIYSDVGYFVLGALVERVSGKDLASFVREAITEPLRMKETAFTPSGSLKDRAAPTEQRNGEWIRGVVHDPRAFRLGGVAGNAGLFSTARDVVRYARAVLSDGELEGRRILSPRSIRAMMAPHDVPGGIRALGWDVATNYSSNRGTSLSRRSVGHGGYTGTSLWIDPEKDLFVLFLSNRVHPDGKGAVNALAGRIATIAGELPLTPPRLGPAARTPVATSPGGTKALASAPSAPFVPAALALSAGGSTTAGLVASAISVASATSMPSPGLTTAGAAASESSAMVRPAASSVPSQSPATRAGALGPGLLTRGVGTANNGASSAGASAGAVSALAMSAGVTPAGAVSAGTISAGVTSASADGSRRAAASAGIVTGTATRVAAFGIDVLEQDDFALVRGARVALIANDGARDAAGLRTIDVLKRAPGVHLVALLAPEHGIGANRDERIPDGVDQATGLPIFSLYGKVFGPTAEMLSGVDTIVFDLQDAGARFFTYASTLHATMRLAAEHDLRVLILDRPNPIDGVDVAGPMLRRQERTFVNHFPLPVRHGMTMGELAELMNADEHLGTRLQVVRVRGWRRTDYYDATGHGWVPPSPNLRTIDAAVLYPGVALVEGTNVSVGRGTDRPFQIVGAPWMDGAKVARVLSMLPLPGVSVERTSFKPQTGPHAGQLCQGIALTVRDRARFDPVRLGVAIAITLRRAHPRDWDARKLGGMIGNPDVTSAILAGRDLSVVEGLWREELESFRAKRSKYLLYGMDAAESQ